MSNHDRQNHRYYSHEDVPRVYGRRSSTSSLESGISSLYCDSVDFLHQYIGAETEQNAVIGGSSRGSYSKASNELYDSDQALHGSGVFSGKSGSSGGSTRYSCNNGGKTLFDSDQAMCSSGVYTQSSGSASNSSFDCFRAVAHYGSRENTTYQERSTNFSSLGVSQSGLSNQYDNSYVWRHRSNLSQISNFAQPFYESTEGTTAHDGDRGTLPYQIEFQVENHGKQISGSKRTIHFRFGFANKCALSMGSTGHDCRGIEHHLCIIWSITGSKRLISMDGREVMYSAGKRANESRRADVLHASWVISDHSYELMCYSYKPALRPFEKRDSRWKQYNLIIDGRCYFDLPQISDLSSKNKYASNTSVHASDLSLIGGRPSMSSASQSSEMKNEFELKRIIQARIAEQRSILSAASHSVLSQSRRARSPDDNSVRSGVVSVTPSELTDLTNRSDAASTHNLEPATTTLHHELTRSCIITGPRKQTQGQLQSLLSQHHHNALATVQPSSSQHHRQLPTQSAQYPQSDFRGQLKLHDSQTSIPPPRESNMSPGLLITYAPQQPPSYEQITRSILCEYNNSAVEYNAGGLTTVLEAGYEANSNHASDVA